MENLFNLFNINFAKAQSQSFCFLQYIENWKIDLIFFNINFEKPWSVSEYLGQSEINVLQEAKPFATMSYQN